MTGIEPPQPGRSAPTLEQRIDDLALRVSLQNRRLESVLGHIGETLAATQDGVARIAGAVAALEARSESDRAARPAEATSVGGQAVSLDAVAAAVERHGAALLERMTVLENGTGEKVEALASRVLELQTLTLETANRWGENLAARLLVLQNRPAGADATAMEAALLERITALENGTGEKVEALASRVLELQTLTLETANRWGEDQAARLLALTNSHAATDQLCRGFEETLKGFSGGAAAIRQLDALDGIGDGQATALFRLAGIECKGGDLYSVRCPPHVPPGDSNGGMRHSRLLLLEDGIQLGPAHSNHERISAIGRGAYSHWGDTIYFSASDGSDPRSNGRSYIGLWTAREAEPRIEAAYQVLAGLERDFSSEAAYAAVEDVLSILYPAARMGEDKKLFWMDEELLRDYRRFDDSNMRSVERKAVVYNLVRALGNIEGDLAECGAYRGATAHFMAKADREAGRARPFHLFDSFEGLSPPDAVDGTHWHKGDLASGEATIRANLSEFDGISIYRGWIPDRFQDVERRSFAFVHLDVDLYKPTLDSLEFFYPRVVENGIILCDDSGTATCPGATRAMTEFFADKPERIISLPTGQDFIIKRRSDGGSRPSPGSLSEA